jgi:hypothetical protein
LRAHAQKLHHVATDDGLSRAHHAQPRLFQGHRGAVEDDHLRRHADEPLEIGFQIQRQVGEDRRRLREQHPDVDVAHGAGAAARDAPEQIGSDDLGGPGLKESAQPMLDGRVVHSRTIALPSAPRGARAATTSARFRGLRTAVPSN